VEPDEGKLGVLRADLGGAWLVISAGVLLRGEAGLPALAGVPAKLNPKDTSPRSRALNILDSKF
jgi:hypothetical protein